MKILATLPVKGRDLRLDLFRGVANWGIFLDHIPHNVVNWVTTRNYGFSDAADLFIFISGYTVAFVFARIMLERGFVVGASRLLKRVWQIYVAHVFLFVIYLAEIGYLGQRYGNSSFADEFNIRGFLADPAQFLFEGLILRFKPVNMDVLPLYIVLMGVFPPILWLMLRRPNMTLTASGLLYLMARHFSWNVRPIQLASGISIHSPGNFFSRLGPGLHLVERHRRCHSFDRVPRWCLASPIFCSL